MAIIDRVKFDGIASRDWVIYKHPSEKLVAGTQLIVGEGQVAVFVKGGKVCDIFAPGTYTLSTGNLPILSAFVNIPFGGKTPFTAEIYYINTVAKLDILWGTSDPVQLIDPKYLVRLRIRAFGQMGLKISNCKDFITNIIGSMNPSDVVKYDKVLDFYRGILVSKVKSDIADIIINDKISALEITPHLDEISAELEKTLAPEFEKFGFTVINFYIKSINFPEEDFDKINTILEDKAAFDIMGDSRYAVKRSFDVYEGAANNEGGGLAGAMVAGGVGLGAGAALAQGMPEIATAPAAQSAYCPSCHAANPEGSKFCNSCGSLMKVNKNVVKCPSCGNENPAGSKFCNECGQPFSQPKCQCGAELRAGAKFCNECGRKVGE